MEAKNYTKKDLKRETVQVETKRQATKEFQDMEDKSKWKLILFDLETVPDGKPAMTRTGRSIPNSKRSKTIQISMVTYDGQVILPNLNINPQVDWNDIKGFTKYAEKAWDLISRPQALAKHAGTLPTLTEAWPIIIRALESLGTNNIILAGHNIHGWDIPVLKTQMSLLRLNWPEHMNIKTWDTRSAFYKWSNMPKGTGKWGLDFLYQNAFKNEHIAISVRHTAMGDTIAMHKLMQHLIYKLFGHKKLDEFDFLEWLLSSASTNKLKGVQTLRGCTPLPQGCTPLAPPAVIRGTTPLAQFVVTKTEKTGVPTVVAAETKTKTKVQSSSGTNTVKRRVQPHKGADVIKSRMMPGMIVGFGKLTISRLKIAYKISTFGDLFKLYKTDQQFVKLLNTGAKKSLAKNTINDLICLAKEHAALHHVTPLV